MRLAAGLLILLISGGWGLRRRGLLKRRCTLLSELRLLLEQYSIEIACTAPTLDQLAEEGRGEFGAILRECSGNTPDIRRAWSEAVERISALPYCQEEEAEILSALGKELAPARRKAYFRCCGCIPHGWTGCTSRRRRYQTRKAGCTAPVGYSPDWRRQSFCCRGA